jgi:lysozyme
MISHYLNRIRSFEGYTREAKWDYAQHSNGYGTRAAYPGEVIDRAEAERRFQDEISKAAALVDKFAPELDTGSRAALTSLTFNAGTKWMSSGLGYAIRSGDLEEAKKIFVKYTNAGGADLPGLVSRRSEEVTWFQNAGPSSLDPRSQDAAAAVSVEPRQNVPSTRSMSAEGRREGAQSDDAVNLIASANDLFEQLEMDRVRYLILSKGSARSEQEDRRVL